MVDIAALTAELHGRVEWQKTPDEVYREDLAGFIVAGIKDLYVMTGRAARFTDDLIE